MSLIDLLVAAYAGYGVWRGWRRGLPNELPRVVGITVFAVSGCGLFRWTNHALMETSRLAGQTTGGLGVIGIMVATWFLVRHFRAKIGDWAKQRYGKAERVGAVAGGVRAVLLACVVLLVFAHWPLKFLTRPVTEGSLLGRGLTRYVLPVYEKTHDGAL